MSIAKYYQAGIELLYIRRHTCHRLQIGRDHCSLEIDLCPTRRRKEEGERERKQKITRINKSMAPVAHTHTRTLFFLTQLIAEMRRLVTRSSCYFPISLLSVSMTSQIKRLVARLLELSFFRIEELF